MKRKIFIARDYYKGEYVWAMSPNDLQVASPTWGDVYNEVFISERQLETLQNGGWIAACPKTHCREDLIFCPSCVLLKG